MDLIKVENNVPMLDKDVSQQIAAFEKQIKFMKAEEERLKKAIQDEMELKLIRGIKTDELNISYIPETYAEHFNKDEFRLAYPDLYDEFIEMRPKKAFIKIGVK